MLQPEALEPGLVVVEPALRVDDLEPGTLRGRRRELRRVLARLVVVGEQHDRRVLLTRLLAHVLVLVREGVGLVGWIRRHAAAAVPEPVQLGGRLGRAAVRVVDAPPEIRHVLLVQIGTGRHGRHGRHDRKDLHLGDETPRLRRRARRVLLVVSQLGELELDALDLVVVVEPLEACLGADGGVREVRGNGEAGGGDGLAVEAAHRRRARRRDRCDRGHREDSRHEHRTEAANSTKA